uniref:Amine oxidase domain-containing protein n=1 Tax=Romanomermis culicivorax TaxID=13658 RepID=A0A915IP95_ROMCU
MGAEVKHSLGAKIADYLVFVVIKFSNGQGYVELGAQYVQNLPNSIVLKMAQDLGVVPSQSSLLNLVNNRAKIFSRQTDLSLREGGSSVDQKLTTDFKKLLLRTEMEAAKGRLKLSHFPEHVKRSLGAVQAYEYSEWRLKRKEHLTNDQTKDLDLLFKFATKAAELDYEILLISFHVLENNLFFGCDDWHDVSLASTSQFYTVGESNDDFQLLPVDRRGYTALIDQLASKLPQHCIRLSSPCSSVNWQGPRVDLDFEDGSSITSGTER